MSRTVTSFLVETCETDSHDRGRVVLLIFLATTVHFAFVLGEGTGEKSLSENFLWASAVRKGSDVQVWPPSL